MLDAKLIAMGGIMGVLVYVGIGYVRNEAEVLYSDPFAEKFSFMCDKYDGDGCAAEVCKQVASAAINLNTPLTVSCEGFDTVGSLADMGNSDDWETRAATVNSEEPAYATAEWCAVSSPATGGITITDSSAAAMGECSALLPVIAASVNAEYERFVARAHLKDFEAVVDLLCADTSDADLQFGCEELRAGFKGADSEFKVPCADGTFATFVLDEMILNLDKIRASGGDAAEVEAYMTGQCGRRLEAVAHIPDFHEPALTTARRLASMDDESLHEEIDAVSTFDHESKKNGASLKDVLNKIKSEKEGRDVEEVGENHREERALWGHRHNPHSHTPSDCQGCSNKCGNSCFGRCGPGCTKWSACGCGGAKSHNACWQHDTKCSCGAMWYPSCLALAVTSVINAPSWLSGANYGNSGCGGANWLFHQSVQGWGSIYQGWNDPGIACSKAGNW